jgi:hypothetical protein
VIAGDDDSFLMPGSEDLPAWGGGGRGHAPPYARDRGERLDRAERSRRDFVERPPGFGRNAAPIGPPPGPQPLKRRGPGRPYVYGEARYGPPGMRGVEAGPAPYLEGGPPPPAARRAERDAFYGAGSPPYGPGGDFPRRDAVRDAGYGPEPPGDGPGTRAAFSCFDGELQSRRCVAGLKILGS